MWLQITIHISKALSITLSMILLSCFIYQSQWLFDWLYSIHILAYLPTLDQGTTKNVICCSALLATKLASSQALHNSHQQVHMLMQPGIAGLVSPLMDSFRLLILSQKYLFFRKQILNLVHSNLSSENGKGFVNLYGHAFTASEPRVSTHAMKKFLQQY